MRFAPLVAILIANAAPAAAQLPTPSDAPAVNACGQYTTCCPPSTKISRDGDWKAEQQVAGNITSNYRLQYTMKPLLNQQMGAFANYFTAAIGTGYGNTAIMLTNVFIAGTGPTPNPTAVIGVRLDKWAAPFSGVSTNSSHASLTNYTLVPNTWYVLETSFNMGNIYPLDCGVQKFAYRVEYKPMKTMPGAPLAPSVTIIPYNGTLPNVPMNLPQPRG
jgi:hypothetical protein